MSTDVLLSSNRDSDPTETKEWLDSFRAVLEYSGPDRARFLLETLKQHRAR